MHAHAQLATTEHRALQVVGYMGVPFQNVEMTDHAQYITVRNSKVGFHRFTGSACCGALVSNLQ